MANDFTKVVRSYLAPLLALAVMLLTLFAYLAPAAMLQTQVALMIVFPGRSVPLPNDPNTPDGPTIRMGMLGSCAQSSNSAQVHCTTPSVAPNYDFSVLPSNFTNYLEPPMAISSVLVAVALAFWGLFFIIFTLLTHCERLGEKASNILGKPVVAHAAAWFGMFGYVIGLGVALVNRIWFGKAVTDFNMEVTAQGKGGPQIQADLSNGFTLLWVAYALGLVPLMCVLMNVHHAGKSA